MMPTWERTSHRTKQTLDEDLSRDRSVHGMDMSANASRDRPVGRVTVPEAAKMMGVTQSAIRKRVHRGTIPWDKDHEGRIYVYVEPSEMRPETRGGKARDTSAGQSGEELVEAYRDQVEFLRRELERKDTLLMSLMQCVPELEPAKGSSSEMREPPVSPSAEAGKGTPPPAPPEQQEASQRRSWWRGFLGLE
jgi:hypothetical protein